MKASHVLAVSTVLALGLLWGLGARVTFAQRGTNLTKEQASKYPPDIIIDTMSRLSLPKREEFDNDEERQAWDHAFKEDPTLFDRFHSTGHRLHLPVIADHYRESLYWLRAKAPLDPRLKELTTLVATRESNNYIEYPRKPKDISPEIVDIVLYKKSASGLPEKDQAVINLVREMIRGPKVASKTYADATRLFGERGVMTIASFTIYYAGNSLIFHLYDKQLLPDQKYPFPNV